jgi:hypothetical protein
VAINQADVIEKSIYGPVIIHGPGDPSSLGYAAPIGALYLRVDAPDATHALYVKTSAPDTGWTNK